MPHGSVETIPRQMGLSVCIIACKDLSLNLRTIRQAKSLARAGHSVTVVGFGIPDGRLAGDHDITLLRTGAPPYPALVMANLWALQRLSDGDRLRRRAAAAVATGRSRTGLFARRAMNCLAGRRFDVVQAHFDKALTAASELARSCGAKLVFDSVEVPFDEELIPRTPSARALRIAEIQREVTIAKLADGWITVNETLADAAVKRFGIARPLVLRNCQEAGCWPSDGRLRKDVGLTGQARVLLHLNTMREGEGLDTIIDALAELPSDVHLVGLGPVPEKGFIQRMRRRAIACGVADRFHIAPLQPPHSLPSYIAGADIGIIARQGSLQNMRFSLPNRFFQLVAARLPIITTPLPEIARMVRLWNVGVIFEEGNAHSLAASVRTMLESATWTGFREAAKNAVRSLTWEQESMPYVRYIERVAEQASERDRPAEPGMARARVAGD
jgi:glycogen(starch) synthase